LARCRFVFLSLYWFLRSSFTQDLPFWWCQALAARLLRREPQAVAHKSPKRRSLLCG
jgi:hypothetical protein